MKLLHYSLILALLPLFWACGSSGNSTKKEETKVDDEAFYATQPLHSGLYDADSYDIAGGNNPRKGKFDGRIYFTLSPEQSAFYVFENGNRTKIDYLVALQHPFERGDSGIYRSVDRQDMPVTLTKSDTLCCISFHKAGADVSIGFNPNPRHTGTALDILEKMNEVIQKNKSK